MEKLELRRANDVSNDNLVNKRTKENIFSNTRLISFCINVFFVVLTFLTVGFWFEENDDIGMITRTFAGCEYIVFQNVFMGYLYKFLFSLYKGLNWYALIFYILAFIASYLICCCFFDCIHNKKIALISSVVFCAFFSADIYSQMQFTKLAAFLMIAGITYLYCKRTTFGKHTVLSSVVGIMLVIVGSMIRYSSMYICIVYAGIVSLLYVYDFFDADKKLEFIKQKIGLIIMFCIAFVLCFGAGGIGKKIVMSDPDYKMYSTINSARASVVDRPFNEYDDIKEQLSGINISENDYNCIRRWIFADSEFYTADKFHDIAKYSEKKANTGLKSFIDRAEDVFFNTVKYDIVIASLLMLLMCILMGGFKKRKIPLLIVGFLSVCFLYCVLILTKNRVKYRVEYGIWLYLFVFLILCLEQRVKLNLKRGTVILVVLVGVFAVSEFNFIKLKEVNNENNKELEKYSDYMAENPDDLFFVPTLAQFSKMHTKYNALSTALCRGANDNMVALGGSYYMHPFTVEKWDSLGIKNPLRDIVDKENAYLMSGDDDASLIFQYIREHYYDNIDVNKRETIGEMSVYKVTRHSN